MFLHLLTESSEKIFFLEFAYLIAVANKENKGANIPICACSDIPEKGEYAFWEFAPGFEMQISELLILRKFAEEMGIVWEPVSSFSPSNAENHPELFLLAKKQSPADILKAATKEAYDESSRSAVLQRALAEISTQANASEFAVEKRKAILMEATATAYADGAMSELEQGLLVYFCELCCLDKGLIEEFKSITREFSQIYSKSLELITK